MQYFGIKKLISENSDPLSALMSRSIQGNRTQDASETATSTKNIAEASKQDTEITSLIKKDVDRTLPELDMF